MLRAGTRLFPRLISCDGYGLRFHIGIWRWTMIDLTVNKKEKEDREKCIQPHKTKQCKQTVCSRNVRRVPNASTHQAVNQPRLTTNFGGQPSSSVRNIWKRQAQHDYPKQPPHLKKLLTPEGENRQGRYSDENRAQSSHDVIREVQQRNVGRPVLSRECIQSFHLRFGCAVHKKAEDFVHYQRIVNSLMLHVRLAH